MTSDQTADPAPGEDLVHFLYRSTARTGLGDHDLKAILTEAQSRNARLNLTGCLHYEDGLFFQWLEGPRHALDSIIEMIRGDERHSEISVLSYGPLAQRRFADWAMRSTDRNRASLLDWFAARQVSTIDRGAYAGSVGAFLQAISA